VCGKDLPHKTPVGVLTYLAPISGGGHAIIKQEPVCLRCGDWFNRTDELLSYESKVSN
jgi:hypothetical protein